MSKTDWDAKRGGKKKKNQNFEQSHIQGHHRYFVAIVAKAIVAKYILLFAYY